MAEYGLLTSKAALAVGVESNYGVAAPTFTPVLPNKGVQFNPQSSRIKRDVIRPTLTPIGSISGATHWSIDLSTEWKGGGLSASVLQLPEIAPLLLASSMVQTAAYVIPITSPVGTFKQGESLQNVTQSEIVGTVVFATTTHIFVRLAANEPTSGDELSGLTSSATAVSGVPIDAFCFAPSSDVKNSPSLTIDFNVDGMKYRATGCRASVEVSLEMDKFPTAKWTIQGLWNDPVDTLLPSLAYNPTKPRRCVNAAIKLGDTDMAKLTLTKLMTNLNNTLTPKDSINAVEGREAIMITAREPSGSVDPSATLLANYNPYGTWRANTEYGIVGKVGDTLGNQIWTVLPRVVNTDTKTTDRNGFVAYDTPFEPIGDGDDELYFFFC